MTNVITYLYAVQRPCPHPFIPGATIPGYVQIDEIVDEVNTRSTSLSALAEEGIFLPPVPAHLPTGSYTLEQILFALHNSP